MRGARILTAATRLLLTEDSFLSWGPLKEDSVLRCALQVPAIRGLFMKFPLRPAIVY